MTTSFGPQLTVDDPVELIVCQTIIIVWSNGLPPYFITVHNDQTPDSSPLTISNGESSTSVAWTVKFPPGAAIVFHCTDSTGATARTSPVIVQEGGDISCLPRVTQSDSTVNTSPTGIGAFITSVSETPALTDLPVLNVSSAGSTTTRSEVNSTSIPRDTSVTLSGSRTSDTASGIPIETNTPTESAHPTNAVPGDTKKSAIPVIIGAVVGVTLGLSFLIGAFVLFNRCRRGRSIRIFDRGGERTRLITPFDMTLADAYPGILQRKPRVQKTAGLQQAHMFSPDVLGLEGNHGSRGAWPTPGIPWNVDREDEWGGSDSPPSYFA